MSGPNEKETEKPNGRREVEILAEEDAKDAVKGPIMRGRIIKMKRGTASHKTAHAEVLVDLWDGLSCQNGVPNAIEMINKPTSPWWLPASLSSEQ